MIESGDDGDSWSNRRAIAQGAMDPRLVSDSGKLYMTYFSYPDEVGIKFMVSEDGYTWTSPKTISAIKYRTSYTEIYDMVVKSGNIFMVYTTDGMASKGAPDNKCKINVSRDDGISWKEMENATFTSKDSLNPSLLITGGRLHFFWIEESEEEPTMFRYFIFDWSFEDSDKDGVNDLEDIFPLDPLESEDTDLDGIGNNGDSFPTDPSASLDSDEDGHPDSWNAGMDEGNSTTGLKMDKYPNDKEKWQDPSKDVNNLIFISVGIVIFIVVVVVIGIVLFVVFKKKKVLT